MKLVISVEMTDVIFKGFYKEKKDIFDDIIWSEDGEGGFTTNYVIVYCNTLEEGLVTLKGERNKVNEFSLNIIFERNKTIIRYDNFKHVNKKDKCTGADLKFPHKHKFKKNCPRDLAGYVIPESEINSKNVNQAFEQFLKECNIVHNGAYYPTIGSLKTKQKKITEYHSFHDLYDKHIGGGCN